MDTGKLLLLGGVGAGAWWLYSKSAAPTATTSETAGGSPTPTPAAGGTSTTGGSSPAPPPFFPTPAAGSGPSLASIWAAAQKAAASDPNFAPDASGDLASTPYRWTFYLGYVQPTPPAGYSGTWPPDPVPVFSGVDLTQPMSGKTFWGAMQPYLAAKGLSGLFGMRGLGALPACSDVSTEAGFVGPVQCDPTGGQVNYTPYDPLALALLEQQQSGSQPVSAPVATPTLLGLPVGTALALGAGALVVLMVATGGHR